MKQTRGAIKFLLAEYRAILKHALLAMFMSTVAVSVADAAETNINNQADFDSAIYFGQTGYYLSSYFNNLNPTVNIKSDVFFNNRLNIGFAYQNEFVLNFIGSSADSTASLTVDNPLWINGGAKGQGWTSKINLEDYSYLHAKSYVLVWGSTTLNVNSPTSRIDIDDQLTIENGGYGSVINLDNGASLNAQSISLRGKLNVGQENSKTSGSRLSTTGNLQIFDGIMSVYKGHEIDIGGNLNINNDHDNYYVDIFGHGEVAGSAFIFGNRPLTIGSSDLSSDASYTSWLDIKGNLTAYAGSNIFVNDGALLNVGNKANLYGNLTVGSINSSSSSKAIFNAQNISVDGAGAALSVNSNGVLTSDSLVINNGKADIKGQVDVVYDLTIEDGVLTVGIEDSTSANKATVNASNVSVGGTNASSLTVNTNGVLTSDSLAINNGKADIKGQADVGDLTIKNGTAVNVATTGTLTTRGKVDIGEDGSTSASTGKLSIDAVDPKNKNANFVVEDDSVLTVYVASGYDLKGHSDIKGVAYFKDGLDIGDGTAATVQNVSGELTVFTGDTNVKQNATLNISGSKRAASSETDYATTLNGGLNIEGKVNVEKAGVLNAGKINVKSQDAGALKIGSGSQVTSDSLTVADGAVAGTVAVDGGKVQVNKVSVHSDEDKTGNNAGVIALTNGANFIVGKDGVSVDNDKTNHTVSTIKQNASAFSADASSTLTVNGLGEFKSLDELQYMKKALLGNKTEGTLDGDYTLSSDVIIGDSMTYEKAKSDTYKGVTVLKKTQVTGVEDTVAGTNTWGNAELADGKDTLTVENGSLTLSDSTANKKTETDSYLVAQKEDADRNRKAASIVLKATDNKTATVKFTGSGIVADITGGKDDKANSSSLVVVAVNDNGEVKAGKVSVDKLNVQSGILHANDAVTLTEANLSNGGICSDSKVEINGSVIANKGEITGSSVELTGSEWRDTNIYYAGNGSSIKATAGNVIVAKENDFILDNSSIIANADTSTSTDTGSITFAGKVEALGDSKISADRNIEFKKAVNLANTTVTAGNKDKGTTGDVTVADTLDATSSTISGNNVKIDGVATLNDSSKVIGSKSVTFANEVTAADKSEISGTESVSFESNLTAQNTTISGGTINVAGASSLSKGSKINGTGKVTFVKGLTAEDTEISGANVDVQNDNKTVSLTNTGISSSQSGSVSLAGALTASNSTISGGEVTLNKAATLTDQSTVSGTSVLFNSDLTAQNSTVSGGTINVTGASSLSRNSTVSGTGVVNFANGLTADNSKITGSSVSVKAGSKETSLTNSSIIAVVNDVFGSVSLDGALTATTSTIAGSDITLNKAATLTDSSMVVGTKDVAFKSNLTAQNSHIYGAAITVDGASSLTKESTVNGTGEVTFTKGLTADNSKITGANVKVQDESKETSLTNSSIIASVNNEFGGVSLDGALTATNSTVAGGDITLNKAASLKDNSKVIGTKKVTFKQGITAENSQITGASVNVQDESKETSLTNSSIIASANNVFGTVSLEGALTATNSSITGSNITLKNAATLKDASKVTGTQTVSFEKGLTAYNSEISGTSVNVSGDVATTLNNSKMVATGTADTDGITLANNLVAVSSGVDSYNNLSLAQGGSIENGYIMATGKMSISGMLKLDPSFGYAGQLDLTNNGTLAILKDSIFKVGGVAVTSDNSAEGVAELILDNNLDLGSTGKIYLDGTKTNADLTSEPAEQVTLGSKSRLTINQSAIDAANATQSAGDAVIKMSGSGGIAVSEGASIKLNLDKVKIETIKLLSKEVTEDSKSILNSAGVDLYINNLLYTAVVDTADDNTVINLKVKDDAKSALDGLDPAVTEVIISQASGDGFDINQDNGLGYISRLLQEDVHSAVQAIGSLTSFGFASYAPQAALLADDAAFSAVAQRAGFKTQSGSTLGEVNGDTASIWVTPLYRKQSSDSFDAGSKGYGAKTNLHGLALGADFALPYNLRAGASLHVGKGKAKGDGDFDYTQNDFDFFGAEIYGFYSQDNLSVLADVGFTHISNDVDQGALSADFDSKVLSAGIRGKYLFATDDLDIEPHAGIRLSHARVDGFKVKSSNGTLLNAGSMDGNLIKIPVGVTLSKTFKDDEWSIKPMADLSFTGAFGDKNWSFDSRITGMSANGGKVSVDADVVDGLSISGTLGIEAQMGNTLSVGAGYTFTSSSNVKEHALTASFRYAF